MAQNTDLLQQALSNLEKRQPQTAPVSAVPDQDQDYLQQALANLGQREGTPTQAVPQQVRQQPKEEVAPYLTRPLKTLIGTGQELSEFVTKIPRLFGADIAPPPKIVETGLGEKLGAGAIEYLLGGAALKAVPGVKPALEAVRKIPAIGKYLPFAAGSAAMGAIERPEEPGKGAAIGAVAAPAMELGLAGIGKALHPVKFTKAFLQKALKKGFPKELYPHVEERINNIRSSLMEGSSEETSNRDVFNKMQRHYDELVGHSEDLHGNPITAETSKFISPEQSFHGRYEDVQQMVPDLAINRAPLTKEISKQMNVLNSKLEQFKESPVFTKETADIKNIVDNVGKARISNFSDLDVMKRLVNERLRDRTISSAEKAALIPIKDSLREILPASMEGKTEVKNLWANIDRDYKEQVIPFKETKKNIKSPFIKAYHGGGENIDDLVKSYIKPGKEDLLNNFLKILPDQESKNIAAFDYLKKFGTKSTADNPDAFIKQYSKLSPAQRKKLLPEHYEELNELENLHKRMPIAFKAPKETGDSSRLLGGYLPHGLVSGAAALLGYGLHSPLVAAAGVVPLAYRGLLGQFAKTAAGKKLLMSELEKVGTPTAGDPLLKGLVRGGILGSVLPNGGEK